MVVIVKKYPAFVWTKKIVEKCNIYLLNINLSCLMAKVTKWRRKKVHHLSWYLTYKQHVISVLDIPITQSHPSTFRYQSQINAFLLGIYLLDTLFLSNHNIHKSSVAFVFGLQILSLIDFTKILYQLKPKNKGRPNIYECCDLTKKYI